MGSEMCIRDSAHIYSIMIESILDGSRTWNRHEYDVYRGANYAIIREYAGMYFKVMPPQKMRGGGPGGLL